MRSHFISLIAVLIVAIGASPALAGDQKTLEDLIAKAPAGGSVAIPSGEYRLSDLRISKDLALVGERLGGVVFVGAKPLAKGLIVTDPGISLSVEKIVFKGAASPDKNGAGIRHQGRDLIIRNCVFEDNENGLLATGDEKGRIHITSSQFRRNGHGDGRSHGVYVSKGASLLVEKTRFTATRVGHHIKTLTAETQITESKLDDAMGNGSYHIDQTGGGVLEILATTLVQGVDASNPTMINYDASRGGALGEVRLNDVEIVNRRAGARIVRNPGKAPVHVKNVRVRNEGRGSAPAKVEGGAPYPQGLSPLRLRENVAPIGGARPKGEGEDQKKRVARGEAGDGFSAGPFWRVNIDSQREGIIAAPKMAPLLNPADLAAFRIQRIAKSEHLEEVASFAMAFPPGALRPGPVSAVIDGAVVPAQMDIFARHLDGSVRHAAFAAKLPTSGKRIRDLVLRRGAAGGSGEVISLTDALEGHDIRVEISLREGPGAGEVHELSLADLLRSAAPWRAGPVLSEFHGEAAAGSLLTVRGGLRRDGLGATRAEFAFANVKAFAVGDREMVYDVRVLWNGAEAYRAEGVNHYAGAVWRVAIWPGTRPSLEVLHDAAALARAGAVPHLDRSLGVNARPIEFDYKRLRVVAMRPITHGLIVRNMPMTGGRDDIGPLTAWSARYLSAQTPAAKAVMLAQADAAGAVPWHYHDDKRGGGLIRADERPKFWADSRGAAPRYGEDAPAPSAVADRRGGWRLDTAHKPSLAALAWTVTGEKRYAEELAAEAAFVVYGLWPDERAGGLKLVDNQQIRGSAWSLRDISNAAYLLPDADPMKAYFQRVADANIDYLHEKYVARRHFRAAGEIEGYFEQNPRRKPGRVTTWQHEFLSTTLALIATRGSDKAAALLAWQANFLAGRFIAPDAAPELFPIDDISVKVNGTDRLINSWADATAATRANHPPRGRPLGSPSGGGGYVATARAGLVSLMTGAGSLEAAAAYGVFLELSHSYKLWNPNQRGGLGWSNMFFAAPVIGGRPITHVEAISGRPSEGADLLYGRNSGDKIAAGGGDDIVLGRRGDDALSGGAGDDALIGGPGADVLTGGAGADRFAALIPGFGVDRVEDFTPGVDLIAVHRRLLGGREAGSLAARAEARDGGAFVPVTETDGFLLIGVAPEDLSARDFAIAH